MGVSRNGPDRGIIPRIVEDAFDFIYDSSDNLEFTIKVSIVEIYMEKIRYLLKIKLKIKIHPFPKKKETFSMLKKLIWMLKKTNMERPLRMSLSLMLWKRNKFLIFWIKVMKIEQQQQLS